MSEDVDIAAAAAARDAVVRFWRALRDDDDAELRRVCSGGLWASWGRSAAGIREALGMDREAIAGLGFTTSLRILSDGSWCFYALPADRVETIDTPRWAEVRPLVVRHGPAGWLVQGPPTVPLEGARVVVLPILAVLSVDAGPAETV